MSRRGGGKGGRRNQGGEGNIGQGSGRNRSNGQRPAQVRFPSDHSNRRDSKYSTWATPRFPSDSNRQDVGELSGPGRSEGQGRSERKPGRLGEENRGGSRTEGARPDSSRARSDRDRRGRERQGDGRGSQLQSGGGGRRRSGRPPRGRSQDAPRTTAPVLRGDGTIEPFELFCAYHLGITPSGVYRTPNLNEVAERFGVTPEAIKQALVDNEMHLEALRSFDFDLALAQMDIQVSPPGVCKTELAKGLFEEYLIAKRNARAWDREPEMAEIDGLEADLHGAPELTSGGSELMAAELEMAVAETDPVRTELE